jgi:hypothetical protein
MIQTLQQYEGASISRDFAVGPGRKSAVITESAGEPVFGTALHRYLAVFAPLLRPLAEALDRSILGVEPE